MNVGSFKSIRVIVIEDYYKTTHQIYQIKLTANVLNSLIWILQILIALRVLCLPFDFVVALNMLCLPSILMPMLPATLNFSSQLVEDGKKTDLYGQTRLIKIIDINFSKLGYSLGKVYKKWNV